MCDISKDLVAVLDEIPIGVCPIGRDRRIVFMNMEIECVTGFFQG
jgi:hypothetical protein